MDVSIRGFYVNRVARWFVLQRCKYRYFKFGELRTNPKLSHIEVLKYAVDIFEGYDFAVPDRRHMQSVEISSRVSDVMVLLELVRTGLDSFHMDGAVRYNGRVMTNEDTYISVLDWYWNPMNKADHDTRSLLQAFRNKYDILFQYVANANNENMHYVNRTTRPLILGYFTLVDALSYVHLK